MEKIHFLYQGSAKEPYEITFSKERNNFISNCTCPAAQFGSYCKHRINILAGITNGIVSNNSNQVEIVRSWISGTDIENAIIEVFNAEQKLEEAKKEVTASKKRLGKALIGQ